MKKDKTLSRLGKYTAKNKVMLSALVASALIANAAALVAPYISGRAIDFIKGENAVDFQMILKFSLILLVIYVINALLAWVTTFFTNKLSNRTIETLRRDVFAKIEKLPLSFFDTHPHGDVVSRMTNDVDSVSDGLFQGITQMFSGIVTVLGSLAFMFVLDYKIASFVVVITIICFFISRAIAVSSGKMFRKTAVTTGELDAYAAEMTENLRTVRAFGCENDCEEKFASINARLYKYGQKAQFYSSLVNPTTRYINNIAYVLVGIIGALEALRGNMTVGIISSFLIYATQFARPINDITAVLTQFRSALAGAARIFEIIDADPEEDDSARAEFIPHDGGVIFDNINFSYNKDIPLIENLSINVRPGMHVAIVGPTGAGKTTLVNLLMNFYVPQSGKISVDDQFLANVTRGSLRKNFGMVLQDTWLFSGSVFDNIAYGCDDPTREHIIAAAKAAGTDGFIRRLPKGYDTIIEEGGSNLSAGQKQLLTIARAMASDPKILILDEATSNVDTMTEKRIQNAFLKMTEDHTSFIIAHRLSTIREADLILVMDNGRIVAQGRHKELLGQNGLYAKLCNAH